MHTMPRVGGGGQLGHKSRGGVCEFPVLCFTQRNHGIPSSSLAFGFQYELMIWMTPDIVDCVDHVWNACKP